MKIRVEGGKKYTPKDSDEVVCEIHNLKTTWGELGPIQQLAVVDNLDVGPDSECLLSPKRKC